MSTSPISRVTEDSVRVHSDEGRSRLEALKARICTLYQGTYNNTSQDGEDIHRRRMLSGIEIAACALDSLTEGQLASINEVIDSMMGMHEKYTEDKSMDHAELLHEAGVPIEILWLEGFSDYIEKARAKYPGHRR